MRKLVFVVALTLAAGAVSAPAPAPVQDIDAVRVWNEFALTAVRTTRASDADAARLYAMVNVAMYDAVNGIRRVRTEALVPARGPRDGDPQAAAAAAAHAVLTR
ncbi:MAG: PA-phosphatase, partial [Actinoplanes sp.]